MTSNDRLVSLATYSTWTCAGMVALWMLTTGFLQASGALLIVIAGSSVALIAFRRMAPDDREFITLLFLAALVVRLGFGLMVHVFDGRDFFGPDAIGYHLKGSLLLDYWNGLISPENIYYRRTVDRAIPGWGMNYIVASIYFVAGKNILAAQSFCSVVGAATAPLVYLYAKKVFTNSTVARSAALAIAFFPSFIIWSSQLLKDGLIIFLLVLVMAMVLRLQEKFSLLDVAILVFGLFGIISLRFYIFYMLAVAVAGSFVIGLSNKPLSILRSSAALVLVGLSLTYVGITRNTGAELDRLTDLERLQINRTDLAQSESGFNEDTDISTAEGAISTIPVGLAYLMLAPFPWQMNNLRQAITLPEVLLWWAMIPLMIIGIAYSVRHRLRTAFPILFFTLTLTLAYSIFQGNVGTAYRQRTQIQVFLFIFIAVGWQLWKEKRADRRAEQLLKQRRFEGRLQQGFRNT